MRALADRYCALLEQAPLTDREVFAGEVFALLAALVAAAVALPDLERSDADLLRPSQESWRQRCRDLGQVLGDWDSYWVALDPYAADPSPLGVGRCPMTWPTSGGTSNKDGSPLLPAPGRLTSSGCGGSATEATGVPTPPRR